MAMFGGQDDQASGSANSAAAAPQDDTLNGVADLIGGATMPGADATSDTPPTASMPPKDPTFMPTPLTASPAPAGDDANPPATTEPPAPMVEPADPPSSSAAPPTMDDHDNDELLDIKQRALQQLSPLVGQLDQTPEEKFRTTMMLIQAADNRDLLKDAYEAAQEISDDKERAQALLDIINEINYFTQPKQS